MKGFALLLFFTVFLLNDHPVYSQAKWAAWAHEIKTGGYEGARFRMQARVKSDISDDSASARLWARVDKNDGKSGFFENMWLKPIRNKEWKQYFIEGNIDKNASRLMIGALTEFNGSFYFDDVKVEIEKDNKWVSVFQEDFENGMSAWMPGIWGGSNNTGVNNLFKAVPRKEGNNTSLLITADAIVNYGSNTKAGDYVNANGVRIYYEVYGQGRPLVVLHGNGGSIKSAASHYPDLIKNYKVIAIDSRAQGKSTDTDASLTYDNMAADVKAVLDKLNVDSAFYWGQSDGAILGIIMAIKYPEKVKKVIAYAPNLRPDSSAIYGWAVQLVQEVVKTSKDKSEVKLYTMMRDYPNIPVSDLKKIKAHVLIMGGDRDVISLEHLVEMFRNIPNSHLGILPGSTHGGAWEKKELFMSMLNDFFNKPFSMPDTKDWLN